MLRLDHYRGLRFRNFLVHVRNVPLADGKAGHGRNRSRRIIESSASNE
jgi:hypothetical protein